MDATVDELAGVVDLFGGLTRTELERALTEAAFRADGRTVDETALSETIDRALDSFGLVRYERPGGGDDAEPLLVAGPTAFPSVPEHAEDVPHILDVEPRRLDRAMLGERVAKRFETAAATAVDTSETERIRHLIDVSYDIEAWAPVELRDERQLLEGCLE